MTDQDYMKMAISQARKAKGFTSPNPCVGAVVVRDDGVVGKGFHKAAGMPHAEVEAIDDAKGKAFGATIYVTLEPCNHYGKTPPCTQKILDAGIKKVVVGCKDPNPYVSGGGIEYLKRKGVEVVSGVLEKECERLIEDFIWYTRNDKKPFVVLKSAATLDGYIATSTGDSKWITNEKSRQYGHALRHEADAILIGSGTLHADDPSLTARIEGRKTKDPLRVILDTRLTIKPRAKVLNLDSRAKTLIFTAQNTSPERIKEVEKSGAMVLTVGLKDSRLDLEQVMIKLGQMSVLSLLIEGGGTVAAQAIKDGIVNKVVYFLAPKILGGNDGIPVLKGKGPKLIKDVYMLKDMTVDRIGDDIVIEGYLK